MTTVTLRQKAPQAKTNHITPQKQLEELIKPCAAPIAERIQQSRQQTGLYCHLECLIAHYAVDEPRLTNWFIVLEILGFLPRYVPRLPFNMFHGLMGKCPVFESQKGSNGSSYKVIDTSVLYLIPAQSESLTAMVENIENCARKKGVKNPDSYKIHKFYEAAKKLHDKKKRQIPMQWHLTTIRTMPGSHTVKHGCHAKQLSDLNARAFVDYRFVSLHTFPLVLFFHKVATGQRLYQVNNLNLTGHPSFSYVIERVEQENLPLAVGAFSEKGLIIGRAPKDDDYDNTGVGITVERLFY